MHETTWEELQILRLCEQDLLNLGSGMSMKRSRPQTPPQGKTSVVSFYSCPYNHFADRDLQRAHAVYLHSDGASCNLALASTPFETYNHP